MIQWLTYIGLALIPFVITNGGGRFPKEILGLWIAAAIGLWAVSRGTLKPIKNNFMFIIILFMLFGTALVPASGVVLGFAHNGTIIMDNRFDIDNLWNYKPILYAVIYLLMFCAIASMEIENIEEYFLIIAWVGAIMAIIAILQKIGFNQFWSVKPTSEIGSTANPEMTSFIGHPTLTAAFICLCLLPSLYLKRHWMTAVMCVSIVLTGSAFGALGIISSLIFWFSRKSLKSFIGALVIIFLAAIIMLFVIKITDHGRLGVWHQAISDLKRPMGDTGLKYGFTGYGSGAYHYANQLMHNSPWAQAHNEFIEFLFNNGTIGIMLLLGAIVTFIRNSISNFSNPESYILMCMFIVSCIIACGTFIWQLGVGQFYTVVFLGLAYNRLRIKKEIQYVT